SSETGLVMNAIAGGTAAPSPNPPEFLQMADASDDAAEKLWATLKGKPSIDIHVQDRSLGSRLDEYMLGLAESDPVKYLERAADRLKLSKPSGEPLPVEAHFLSMMESCLAPPLKDRPPSFWKLPSQALEIRKLAEHAALGIAPSPASFPY